MPVTPDDLANICAVFRELGTRHLTAPDLLARVTDTLNIVAYATPTEIVNKACDCRLIKKGGNYYVLTGAGVAVARSQDFVQPDLQLTAKKALLKYMYLNPKAGDGCCGDFLRQWSVDLTLETFVFYRQSSVTNEILTLLQDLERVGLIEVTEERATVRPNYLDKVNELIAELRGAVIELPGKGDSILKEVGDIAEEHAMEYEKARLLKSGFDWLVPLVEQISLVDQSAGYDVRSCRGYGKKPETQIFVEVKGTRHEQVEFFWSNNERLVAAKHGPQYWIYCFYDVDLADRTASGPHRIQNPHSRVSSPDYVVTPRDVWVRKS